MKQNIHFRLILSAVLILLIQGLGHARAERDYVSFPGDPLNARIYTLDNGLKVYLSVYDEEPRIQTYVAVRVGSKHDPAETTGLAHYFEHLMFKGTSSFGTIDYEKEKALLDKIESLFEVYRLETDETKRRELYREIDSISYIASTFAIANEYDRLMTAIGSVGTNAGTSNDYTIYMENVPSNQLENWARIQGDRFSDPVLRLFHTELETVYEEKNMSLTNDGRKASEALYAGLFPNHPYGLQTTLGESEHLKNPSIINIRNFFDQYYVPNNMAVVMAGDFDPDEAIRVIEKHFGHLQPAPLPELAFGTQPEITSPIVKEVVGQQAENIQLGWRFEGASSDQVPMLRMISMILANGRAGLIDQNLNKPMATLGAYASARNMADYSVLTLSGRNKRGQSLDEVKELLLGQLDLLKKGDFPDWLMEAAINNLRLQEMRRVENNRARAMSMAMAFLNGVPYEKSLETIDQLSAITKADVVAFANEHLRDNNYVVVYKRQGQLENVPQVDKPQITPIFINRDEESPLLTDIKASTVDPIEPVFINYETDITRSVAPNSIEVLYAENQANPTFTLTYYWEMGSYHDKHLPMAGGFINFLGTGKMTAEEISNEFYKLACTFSVSVGTEETRITISGLSENLRAAVGLFEELVWNATGDETALRQYVDNLKKSRQDSKANQQANFQALVNYATFGSENPFRYSLTDAELDAITSQQLIQALQNLWGIQHSVVFFGPQSVEQVVNMINTQHRTPATLASVPQGVKFVPAETTENKVFFAHYDANQSYLQTITKGMTYDPERIPLIQMYNGYFGGGMNAIVFQEMREKRGLAYTARSNYSTPSKPDEHYINFSYIATQNDKVVDAFSAFNELFNEMPLSETSFRLAQEQLVSNIRTQRTRDTGVIWNYINARKMGLDKDIREDLYRELPGFTLEDVSRFNQTHVKGQPKTYVILGDENVVDFAEVERLFGPVTRVSKEELFIF
jgi:predicted Zn-dependent peptidase